MKIYRASVHLSANPFFIRDNPWPTHFPGIRLAFSPCESFSGLELHGNGTDELGFECKEVKSHGFSSTDSFDTAFDWRGPVMAL